MTTPGIRLRPLGEADLPFADSLRALAGWNQTPADWRRLFSLEPSGCFLAERDGKPVGTATTLVHGAELGWIGMLIVHPNHRRRGIGRALLEHCIAHLRALEVRCIKLDATPAGRKVYDTLGFREEWTLARWQRRIPPLWECDADPCSIRPWRVTDTPSLTTLDADAFGVSRSRLLFSLQSQGPAWVGESNGNPPAFAGFGMLRKGSRAMYLGPVAASHPEIGRRLVRRLLAAAAGQEVFWDIPDRNTAAVEYARRHGFNRQRHLVRMFLGDNSAPGNPAWQFALSGPETG